MKISQILLAALVGAIVAIGAAHFLSGPVGAGSHKESAFDRVMRTGVIRCGYVSWAPFLVMNPETKEKSGIAVDMMNAVANEMNLKVDWVDEIGWGNFHEGLNSGRYDVMCVPVWESGARARVSLLTRPLYDTGIYVYAREDDHRFDKSLESVNDPSVRVVVIDGDITQSIRRMNFPKTQELNLSGMSDAAQFLLSVTTRKADVSLDNPFEVEKYNKDAKIKLKAVAGGQPVQMFGNAFAVKVGETELKAALDSTIGAIFKNGTADRIVKKYKGFAMTTWR